MIDGLFALAPVPAGGARLPADWDEEYHEASKLPARPPPRSGLDIEPSAVPSALLMRVLAGIDTPLEVLVVALRVPGLARGAHHYDPSEQALRTGPVLDPARFHSDVQLGSDTAPAAYVALLATFARFRRAYGLRGYRHALVAAGRAAEAMATNASVQGLHVRHWTSWADDAADRGFGLDGVDRSCVYLLGVDAAARVRPQQPTG